MKQTDIYTEALSCLCLILWADHPEFKNWIDWLERDIQDWTQRREVAHHLRAYGGMGSFNDLPSMRGNHDYMREIVKADVFTTCGGDGGRSICGGLGIFLGFLPCSPHCKPEVQENKQLNGDYDFCRPIIRVEMDG